MSDHEYSMGIMGDGAAILKNGQPMAPEQIVNELQVSQERISVQNEKLNRSDHFVDANKMAPAQPDYNGLIESEIEISTSNKGKLVPSLAHTNCPGLAVTMGSFGCFGVTHVPSGLRIGGLYERASRALAEASQFALIANAHGKGWAALDKEEVLGWFREIQESEVPFEGFTVTTKGETRKMMVSEWHQSVRGMHDEFPWEETDPYDVALVNFGKLGGDV